MGLTAAERGQGFFFRSFPGFKSTQLNFSTHDCTCLLRRLTKFTVTYSQESVQRIAVLVDPNLKTQVIIFQH